MTMNLMNNWGINSRVIFTAIVPVIIFSLVFGTYIRNERTQDLEREINERGRLIAINLASAAEFPVATKNISQIRVLVDSAMNQKDVIGVVILDESGNQIFRRGSYGSNGKGDVTLYAADIISTTISDSTGIFSEEQPVNTDDSKLLLGTVEVYISNESYKARQNSILERTIVMVLLSILASTGLAMLTSSSVVRPVRDVIEAVTNITHGRLSTRLSDTDGGELGKLKKGINKMAETIESSQSKLEHEINQATSELEKIVGELKIKNQELDIARSEAMQAKDAKSEFLANMSHEIRTPLNAIIGFSRQIEKTSLDKQQTEYSRTINSAAKQLLTVIDDILSFSKIESGRLVIRNEEFNLRYCLENIMSMLSHAANEKVIEFVLSVEADVPDIVVGDPGRLSQILINFISNAIKFTTHGTIVVHVRLDESDDVIHVSVSDTGCGISLEAQSLLFTPFYQEKQKINNTYNGTGLGLAICKRLIVMMGGEFGFKSEEGVGSNFYFSLPVGIIKQYEYKPDGKYSRVYILDGNESSRQAIKNALLHIGIQAVTVNNNDALISELQKHTKTDNIIVIVSLPPGYHLESFIKYYYKKIRACYSGLVITLSSQDTLNDILKDDNLLHINKPITISSLLPVFSINDAYQKSRHENSTLTQLNGFRVLVAEDNQFNQKYIAGLLKGFGIDVTCVANGQEVIQLCQKENFNLILMDLHMPETDGIAALRILQSQAEYPENLPVIAITADVFANENNKLINEGFTDCLFKPIDEELLYNLLVQYLHQQTEIDFPTYSITSRNSENHVMFNIPEDMRQQLFTDLYKHYNQLDDALAQKNVSAAREQAHTLSGLICYFKLQGLDDIISRIQQCIKNDLFIKAQALLKKAINKTRVIENSIKF